MECAGCGADSWWSAGFYCNGRKCAINRFDEGERPQLHRSRLRQRRRERKAQPERGELQHDFRVCALLSLIYQLALLWAWFNKIFPSYNLLLVLRASNISACFAPNFICLALLQSRSLISSLASASATRHAGPAAHLYTPPPLPSQHYQIHNPPCAEDRQSFSG